MGSHQASHGKGVRGSDHCVAPPSFAFQQAHLRQYPKISNKETLHLFRKERHSSHHRRRHDFTAVDIGMISGFAANGGETLAVKRPSHLLQRKTLALGFPEVRVSHCPMNIGYPHMDFAAWDS